MTAIILATQRTGSTLLCSEFENLGGLGRPGEHFLPWLRENDEAAQLSTSDIEEVFARGRDDTGRLGLKLMADYLPRIGKAMGARGEDPLEHAVHAVDRVEAIAGPAALFRLDRSDVFDQALSSYLATATGLFFRTSDGSVTDRDRAQLDSHEAALAAFDGKLFDTYVVQVERDKAFLAEICDAIGPPILNVTYEDLVSDRLTSLAACCAHGGIRLPEAVPDRWMRKVVGQDHRDRFRQAAEAFWEQRASHGYPVPAIAQCVVQAAE
ncbi:MAG: Stf0 family sulfotransferase [Pseudomonadota bacterium]